MLVIIFKFNQLSRLINQKYHYFLIPRNKLSLGGLKGLLPFLIALELSKDLSPGIIDCIDSFTTSFPGVYPTLKGLSS